MDSIEKDFEKYIKTLRTNPRTMPDFYLHGLRFNINTIQISDQLNLIIRKYDLSVQAEILYQFLGNWLRARYNQFYKLPTRKTFRKLLILPPQFDTFSNLSFQCRWIADTAQVTCSYLVTPRDEQPTILFEIIGDLNQLVIFYVKIRQVYELFAEYNAKFEITETR